MDQAIPASLYLTWKYQDEFKAALQANAEVGGVNWHRGAVAGAIVGMLHPDAVDTLKLKLVSPRRR